MTDDKKRRKSADLGAAPLSRKAKIYMDLAAQRVAAADLQSVGSQAGVCACRRARSVAL